MRSSMRAVAVLAAALAVGQASWALGVGDPAPKLEVAEFVKGEPVATFAAGKIYVVEFWATWCGPCRATIPHLSELAAKSKDVTFIGVDVWDDPKGVKPFVTEMGEKMAYRVATDKIPAGGDPEKDGAMAQSWMRAAGQDGIPTAFVVNGEGKIAWIGHPMEIEQPLGLIVAGKWDLATAAAESAKRLARAEKAKAVYAELEKLGKDSKGQVKVLKAWFAEDPEAEKSEAPALVALLVDADPAEALTYATKVVAANDSAEMCDQIAWMICDPEHAAKVTPELAKFALGLAQKAVARTESKDPSVLDTLAAAYYRSGDLAKAITTEQLAIKVAGEDKAADFKHWLEFYQQKAAGK